ncbi:MAG: hypothetical protein ACOX28_00820 [Bacilli bacterium]|jgi:preprotein translocase subunit SecD
MRRLIAYLTFIFTLIFGVAVNVAEPLRAINGNIEYAQGREFIYAISDKVDPESTDPLPEDAADSVAKMMKHRIDAFGVSEYQIATEGNNIVRVNATLGTERYYDRLAALLNYDADFTVRIAKDDEPNAILEGSEIFDGVKARVEYRGPHPFIVIPLSDPQNFRNTIVQVAERIQTEEGTTPEGEDQSQIVEDAIIVIWSDYDPDKDVYSEREGNDEIKKKIFLSFDYRNMWWDEKETEIAVASQLQGDADTQNYTTAQIKEATDVARYMVTVFNAGKTEYKIDLIGMNKNYAPTVEPLINLTLRKEIAMSKTFIATLIALLFSIIILIVFYRMTSLAMISSSLLTMFFTLIIFNAIALEFSTGALIGLILSGALALFGGITYVQKFKNEVYRGRTFKKAHSEAIRRSNILTLDGIAIYAGIGIISYFLGGAPLAGFATMLLFTAPVALITVLLHNAIAYWLLANNTSTNNKYSYYQIDETKVPDPSKDEEVSYFGRFAKSDYTKKPKSTAISFGILTLASIVLLSVFGGLNKQPFNLATVDQNTTRVYFRVRKNSDIDSASEDKSPESILKRIKIDDADLVFELDDEKKPVYETHNYQKVEEVGEAEITVDYIYYVYRLNGKYSGEEIVTYTSFDDNVNEGSTFIDALYALTTEIDEEVQVSINPITKQNLTPSTYTVGLASLVSIAFVSLYFLLRHGLSKSLSYFGMSSVASLLVLLFFMVTRISVPPLAALGALTAVIFTSLFSVAMYQEHKELRKDPFHNNLDDKQLFIKAEGMSLSASLAFTVIIGVIFLNFIGIGPLPTVYIYASVLLSLLLGALVMTRVTPLLVFAFNALGKKITSARPERKESKRSAKKKAKKASASKSKSAEPEEAIFIGIND